MIGVTVTIVDQMQKVVDASERATFRNLSHAAATIRKDAVASIKETEGPSPAGTPPHTHTAGTKLVGSGSRGRALSREIKNKTAKVVKFKGRLPRSIAYDVDEQAQSALIGAKASQIDAIAEIHEFGGEYVYGGDYPARPYIGPALMANEDRFVGSWQGSIGE